MTLQKVAAAVSNHTLLRVPLPLLLVLLELTSSPSTNASVTGVVKGYSKFEGEPEITTLMVQDSDLADGKKEAIIIRNSLGELMYSKSRKDNPIPLPVNKIMDSYPESELQDVYVATQKKLKTTLTEGHYVLLSSPAILHKDSEHSASLTPAQIGAGTDPQKLHQLFVRPKMFGHHSDDAEVFLYPHDPVEDAHIVHLVELWYPKTKGSTAGGYERVKWPTLPKWLRDTIEEKKEFVAQKRMNYHLLTTGGAIVFLADSRIQKNLIATGLVWKAKNNNRSKRLVHYKAGPFVEPDPICEPFETCDEHGGAKRAFTPSEISEALKIEDAAPDVQYCVKKREGAENGGENWVSHLDKTTEC